MKEPIVEVIDKNITRYTNNSTRWYQHTNAEFHSPTDKLWSVTTILGKTIPKVWLKAYDQKQLIMLLLEGLGIDMPYENTLKATYSKNKDNRPDRISFSFDGLLGDVLTNVRNNVGADSKQKANWGTQAHDIVAKYLKGEHVEEKLFDVDTPVRNSVRSFQDWHNNEGKSFVVLNNLIEKTVYHKTERFAGTADAILADKETGELFIVDWKTGFVGNEARYQVAALAAAWNSHYAYEPESKITKGYIIQLPRDDRKYTIHTVKNMESLGTAFISAVTWHEELQNERGDE